MKTTLMTLLACTTLASATTITTTGRIETSTYKDGAIDRQSASSSDQVFSASVSSAQPGAGFGRVMLDYTASSTGFDADGNFTFGYGASPGDSYGEFNFLYSFSVDEPQQYTFEFSSFSVSVRRGLAGVQVFGLPVGAGVIDAGDHSVRITGGGRGYSDPDYSSTGGGGGSFSASLGLVPVSVPDGGSTWLMLTLGMLGLLALKAQTANDRPSNSSRLL